MSKIMDEINNSEEKKEAEILLKDIFRFKKERAQDLNILETIEEYSFRNDISMHVIGNILSEHDDFLKLFEKHLYSQKYIKSDLQNFIEQEW